MKKYLLILAILLPFVPAAQTSDTPHEGIQITRSSNSTQLGVYSGISLSQTLLKNFEAADPERPFTGFTGGLTFSQLLFQRWFASSGLFYEQKGYQRQFSRMNSEGEKVKDPLNIKFEFNYLTVPFLVNFRTSGKVELSLGTGLYAGYLLSAHTYEPWFEDNWNVPSWEWEVVGTLKRNQTENFDRMDFGLAAKAGISFFLMENLKTGLKMFLNHGLVSATSESSFGDVKYINRNASMGLNVSYVF